VSISHVTEAIAKQSTKSKHAIDRKLGKYLKSYALQISFLNFCKAIFFA
jgi:hypothetical protein